MSGHQSRPDTLEESEIFHILGNDRRRAIVQLLAARSDRIAVSEIATTIASRESETTPPPNNLYKSVYVSLQQTHLPHLEEEAVIDYDTEAKTIGTGPRFDDVVSYVDGPDESDGSVLLVHLGLAVVGLALVAFASLGVPVVSRLDPALWCALVLVAIAGSSLVQLSR